MGWFRTGSSPSRAAPSELQQMWLSLMSGNWSSMAVIPTDPGMSTKGVTAALVEVARLHDVGPFKIVDAEGASVAEGIRLAQEVAAVVASGTRAVVAVDSLMQSLSGVPLVRDADAALLVVRLGSSNFDWVQSTIDIIPPGRLVGSVALPREAPADLPEPSGPAPVEPESGFDVGPETLQAGGKNLVLNGAGECKDSRNGKVYVGALYLLSPSKDATAIVAADEAKAVRMTFLRTVDRERVLGAFRQGFEKNSSAWLAELTPKLEMMKSIIPSEMKEGQVLSIVYMPGKGTSVGAEIGRSVTIEGKGFAEAMFRCWLGEHPDDPDLKDGMLGRVAP